MMITGCKDIRSVLRTPIQRYYDAGEISSRAFHVCVGNEIYTLGELFRVYNDGGLRKLRNCGEYTMTELENILAPIDKTYAIQLVNKLDQYEDLPEPIKTIIVTNFQRPMDGFSADCIRLFYATFKDPCSFYDFFCLEQKNLDERFISIDSWELKHYCYQVLSEIHAALRTDYLYRTLTYELVVVALDVLWFCDDQFAEELEAKDSNLKYKRKALLDDFEFKTEMLSRNMRRLQRCMFPNYSRVTGLLMLSEDEVSDIVYELRTWAASIKEVFSFLYSLNDALFYYDGADGDEIHKEIIARKYPYLTDEKVAFVVEFVRQFGYYPMFYLLREKLAKTEERTESIFAMATGICGGSPQSLAEIGRGIECSRERVRQLLVSAPKDLFKDKGWLHYQFGSVYVIAEDDALYMDVVEREKVGISFESFSLVCMMGFPFKAIKENDVRFLINNRFSARMIDKVCREVDKESKRIKPEIYTMRLDDLLKDVPDDKKDAYRKVVPVILAKAYRMYVNEEGNIVFPPTGIDVIYELSNILRDKGRPMSMKELYAALIKRCPEAKHKSFENVRGKVLRSDALIPIGKSSRYTLAEWKNVYRGSIRDLVADILKKSKTPLHIDTIMKKVLKTYPYTNKKSVWSSICNDKDRFVMFGDGYFGLKRKRYKTQTI